MNNEMEVPQIFKDLFIRIEDILTGINDGVFILNNEGKFVYVNKVVEKNSGISFEQYQKLHFLDIVPREYHQKACEYFNRTLKGEKVPVEEFEYLTADGILRTIEVRAQKIISGANTPFVLVTARNITEHKKAQRALLESLNEKIALYEAIDDGIIIFNPDGTVRDVNKRFEELCGHSREHIIGVAGAALAQQIIHANDLDIVMRHFAQALKGEHIPALRFRFHHPTRGSIPCYFTTAFHKNSDNSLNAIICVIKDISELESLQQQLLHSEKMKAIGTLAGGIAHDFNNILMGIQGNISLMMMEMPKETPLRELAENIQQLIQQATSLTRQLLSFARGGKFEPHVENMNAIINEAINIFGRTHKEIVIKKNLHQNLWLSEIDKGQINQVLLNILVNAWQAMPKGGTITVETDNVEISEILAPAGISPGKYIKISISDTGIGMDEATKQRIFEPFFTTKETGGVGLGLTSAYSIVKHHGGFIEAKSEVGCGSTFTIYLPASDGNFQKKELPKAEIATGGGTILVIDDEPQVLNITAKMLENLGYQTLKAQTKEEAFEYIETQTIPIDCIILDMIMPATNPVEIVGAIRKFRKNIPVIIASGYSMEEKLSEVQAMGCTAFLQKPFRLEDLSVAVQNALSSSRKTKNSLKDKNL